MCERARHSTSVAVFHCETERTGRRVLRSVHGCVVVSGYNMPCSVGSVSDALLRFGLGACLRYADSDSEPEPRTCRDRGAWSLVRARAVPCGLPGAAACRAGWQGHTKTGTMQNLSGTMRRTPSQTSRRVRQKETRGAGPPGTETAPKTIPGPSRHSRHASCSSSYEVVNSR